MIRIFMMWVAEMSALVIGLVAIHTENVTASLFGVIVAILVTSWPREKPALVFKPEKAE